MKSPLKFIGGLFCFLGIGGNDVMMEFTPKLDDFVISKIRDFAISQYYEEPLILLALQKVLILKIIPAIPIHKSRILLATPYLGITTSTMEFTSKLDDFVISKIRDFAISQYYEEPLVLLTSRRF